MPALFVLSLFLCDDMLFRTLGLILFTVLHLSVFSENGSRDSLFKKNYVQDTNYIDHLEHTISFKLFTLNRTNNFSITDVQNNFESNFEPNTGTDLGIGLLYKWLKVGLAFAKLGRDGSTATHGETRRLDLQGHLFTKKVGADISIQLYRGFYLANPNAFDQEWRPGDAYPQRSDIRTLSFGTSVYYVFNHEQFSLQSVYVQSEWQKKSAGSLFLGGSLNSFAIIGDSSISPSKLENSLIETEFFRDVRIRSLAPLVGYSYTLVLSENVFTNLTLSPGLAFANVRLRGETGALAYLKNGITPRLGMRFGLGYNGPKFFGGFSAEYNYQQFRFDSGQGRFGFTRGQARFYLGYRIHFKGSKHYS